MERTPLYRAANTQKRGHGRLRTVSAGAILTACFVVASAILGWGIPQPSDKPAEQMAEMEAAAKPNSQLSAFSAAYGGSGLQQEVAGVRAIAGATMQAPVPAISAVASSTPAGPPATPARSQSQAPVSTPTRTPAGNQSAAGADFQGSWLVVDTVEHGNGVGQRFTFEINLIQTGSILVGGNLGIQIAGKVEGQTASVAYVQPALGYTGSLTWTIRPDGNIEGTFTSSLPNAGRSQLLRRNAERAS